MGHEADKISGDGGTEATASRTMVKKTPAHRKPATGAAIWEAFTPLKCRA